MSENWWEVASTPQEIDRYNGLIKLVIGIAERDQSDDIDALVIVYHYNEGNTLLSVIGPEHIEDDDNVEDWSCKLEGKGFVVELIGTRQVDIDEMEWEIDYVEGYDIAINWLQPPPKLERIGYK